MPSALGFDELIQIRRERPADDPGTSGHQDPDTGEWIPDDNPVNDPGYDIVYEGPADVQDKPQVLARDQGGQAVVLADAVIYLQDESKLRLARLNDVVTVTWADGSVSDATITKVQRLDGALYVTRL